MLENFLREYNINRIFLLTTGLWPFQNKLIRYILWTFCFLVTVSFYPFQVLLLYDNSDDMQMICESGFQILTTTFFIIKHLNDVLNYDKMRWLYEAIDEHWNIFTDDIEIQVMKEYSMLARKIVKYYSMQLFTTLFVLIITPLTPILLDIIIPLNESRPRFFAVEVEFRVNKDKYFLPIYCYINIIMIVGVNITVGVDSMHITLTAHACSLFAAVGKKIENIMLTVNNNNNSESKYSINEKLDLLSEEIIYWEYITCLKKHQLAIEFVDILNSSYQGCALGLLTVILGMLSMFGFRIVYVLDEVKILIKLVLMYISSLIGLMIACYSGQKIMDESQNVFHEAYAAEWYKFSPRLKSLLIIILYRSNIPCELKAGNMISLSIATYATVVRMSMTYYTALLSMQE